MVSKKFEINSKITKSVKKLLLLKFKNFNDIFIEKK